MPLTYKNIEKRYSPDSLNVYLNNVRIAEIYYGNDNSKGDSKFWRAEMKLPGFKNKTVRVSSPKEGKAHVEKCFANWLESTGLIEESQEITKLKAEKEKLLQLSERVVSPALCLAVVDYPLSSLAAMGKTDWEEYIDSIRDYPFG